MVRPASFGWNAQTAASNRFQPPCRSRCATRVHVRWPSSMHLPAPGRCGRQACTPSTIARACLPDAVFPTNWVSLHADGTVVLYRCWHPNRRRERRLDWLPRSSTASVVSKHRVERLLDLTHHEFAGRYLEGTAAWLFDHPGPPGIRLFSSPAPTRGCSTSCARSWATSP